MSNLYGSLSSNKGKDVTKTGSSCLEGHIRGWNDGIRVEASHTDAGDSFEVYQTGGSNRTSADRRLGKLCNGTFEPDKI